MSGSYGCPVSCAYWPNLSDSCRRRSGHPALAELAYGDVDLTKTTKERLAYDEPLEWQRQVGVHLSTSADGCRWRSFVVLTWVRFQLAPLSGLPILGPSSWISVDYSHFQISQADATRPPLVRLELQGPPRNSSQRHAHICIFERDRSPFDRPLRGSSHMSPREVEEEQGRGEVRDYEAWS
jgi:hypothetical protein